MPIMKNPSIWLSFRFRAAAPLFGTESNLARLSPRDIVQGLVLRNLAYGLPEGSVRYVSHNWETVVEGKGKGSSLHLRVYVEV